MRILAFLILALVGCGPFESNEVHGQYSNDGKYGYASMTPGDSQFSFGLADVCQYHNGQVTTGIPHNWTDSAASVALKGAVAWRAWSEVGEDNLPGGKTYYDLKIFKGDKYWVADCSHPWNEDSIGNVKAVVVWH